MARALGKRSVVLLTLLAAATHTVHAQDAAAGAADAPAADVAAAAQTDPAGEAPVTGAEVAAAQPEADATAEDATAAAAQEEADAAAQDEADAAAAAARAAAADARANGTAAAPAAAAAADTATPGIGDDDPFSEPFNPVPEADAPGAAGVGDDDPFSVPFNDYTTAPAEVDPDDDPVTAASFVPRPITEVCARGIPYEGVVPVCERIGPCADCEFQCVMNSELTVIPGEVLGSTLVNTDTDKAAVLCPALTLFARYGTSVPATASLACPTQQEIATLPATQFPAGIMTMLDRHPDLRDDLTDLLQTPGAAAAYINLWCSQYLIDDSILGQIVADFVGVALAPVAGGNSTVTCADRRGAFGSFYKAETFCVNSGSTNYDIRGCIGDNAKWLDDTCVLTYLAEAGFGTRSWDDMVNDGPSYAKRLRDIHFHCIKLSAVECEDPASYGNISASIFSVIGDGEVKQRIRMDSNIGVGIYLDQMANNVKGPENIPANEWKGWDGPQGHPWSPAAFSYTGASGPALAWSAGLALLSAAAVLAVAPF